MAIFRGQGGEAIAKFQAGSAGGHQETATADVVVIARSDGTEYVLTEDQYEAVAASATDQVMGATGAAGDFISQLIIQPATTGAGTVTLKDGTTVIYTFTSGTLSNTAPIIVPLGLTSINGAWKVTTGANVAVLATGRFT